MNNKYAWLSAILLILNLTLCSVLFSKIDAKVAKEENKRLYVEIKSVGVWHKWQVNGKDVRLVYENNNP